MLKANKDTNAAASNDLKKVLEEPQRLKITIADLNNSLKDATKKNMIDEHNKELKQETL